MELKKFNKIMFRAMEDIATDKEEFSCCAIGRPYPRPYENDGFFLRKHYVQIFGHNPSRLPIIEAHSQYNYKWKPKTTRLNMLAMFWAQSIAFKSYKEY